MSERTDALIAELAGACIGMYADVIVNARHELREIISTLERELSEAKERIETVRKKARDDALEAAIPVAQSWVRFAYHDEVATSIRALKDQPSGEA